MERCKICNKYFNRLGAHLVKHNVTPEQYYICYVFPKTLPTCENKECTNKTKFLNLNLGYQRFCCDACARKCKTGGYGFNSVKTQETTENRRQWIENNFNCTRRTRVLSDLGIQKIPSCLNITPIEFENCRGSFIRNCDIIKINEFLLSGKEPYSIENNYNLLTKDEKIQLFKNENNLVIDTELNKLFSNFWRGISKLTKIKYQQHTFIPKNQIELIDDYIHSPPDISNMFFTKKEFEDVYDLISLSGHKYLQHLLNNHKYIRDEINVIKYKRTHYVSRDDFSILQNIYEEFDRKHRIERYYSKNFLGHLDRINKLFPDYLQYGEFGVYEYLGEKLFSKSELLKLKYAKEHQHDGFRSKKEKDIMSIIVRFDKNVVKNGRSVIYPQELDFYLPSRNIAIEYNGIYWHSNKCNIPKDYHLMKSLSCREKGIRLIHIYEFEDFETEMDKLIALLNGTDLYDKRDFNKDSLLDTVPEPELIYSERSYNIYGAGRLY